MVFLLWLVPLFFLDFFVFLSFFLSVLDLLVVDTTWLPPPSSEWEERVRLDFGLFLT